MLKLRILLCAFCTFLFSSASATTQLNDVAKSSSFTLLDSASGMILMHTNGNKPVNPGELVSLMTLYTGLKLSQLHNIPFDSVASISSDDAQLSQSPRRIYLTPDSATTLETLFHAVAVTGAEDASLVISKLLAGNHNSFVEQMNFYARNLGMKNSKFTSPIADKKQLSSSQDLAILSMNLLHDFPQIAHWFSEKEFIFSGLKHRNRNLALWKNSEINGLMSNSDSTDLIASWSKKINDKLVKRSLIAVLLHGEDGEKTVYDALSLIRIGRMDFDSIQLFESNEVIARLEVMKGARDKIEVGSPTPITVTLERKKLVERGTGGFNTKIQYMSPLTAPIKKGDKIGYLQVDFEGQKIFSFPVYALHDVGEGSFFSQYVDSVRIKMNKSNK